MTFTDKKPTVPGAYWWKDEDGVMLVHIKASPTGELWAQGTDCREGRVERMGGLWSSRLVPVDEVDRWVGICEELVDELSRRTPEKNCSCCISPPCSDCVDHGSARELLDTVHRMFSARRVVEGKETP